MTKSLLEPEVKEMQDPRWQQRVMRCISADDRDRSVLTGVHASRMCSNFLVEPLTKLFPSLPHPRSSLFQFSRSGLVFVLSGFLQAEEFALCRGSAGGMRGNPAALTNLDRSRGSVAERNQRRRSS